MKEYCNIYKMGNKIWGASRPKFRFRILGVRKPGISTKMNLLVPYRTLANQSGGPQLYMLVPA